MRSTTLPPSFSLAFLCDSPGSGSLSPGGSKLRSGSSALVFHSRATPEEGPFSSLMSPTEVLELTHIDPP